MTHKLKHLSRYCCKPENETEFEAVKMAAELGGVKIYPNINWGESKLFQFISMADDEMGLYLKEDEETEIQVLEFCRKLRMTEAEAQALEDDRVVLSDDDVHVNYCISDDHRSYIAKYGYVWETRNNGKECYLVKDKHNV